MNGILFDNRVKFTLSDDYMNTTIEDVSIGSTTYGNKIFLNNLAICGIAEKGEEFCRDFTKTQPDLMLPVSAPIFNLHARFYDDFTIVIIQNGKEIKCNYEMFVKYYNDILCKIIKNEGLANDLDFEKKNLKEVENIQKSNPHPRNKDKQ